MWAPNLSSFTSPHWYFGAHIFSEIIENKIQKKNPKYCLHSACFFSTGFDTPCILNFNIVFMHKTLYDIAPMNSLTLENVTSVANSENESAFQCRVKPQSGSWKVRQKSPTDKKWASGYLQPCFMSDQNVVLTVD